MARLLLSELGVDLGNLRLLCAHVLWRRGHSLWFIEGLWRCFSGAKGRGKYILKLFSDMKGKRKKPRENLIGHQLPWSLYSNIAQISIKQSTSSPSPVDHGLPWQQAHCAISPPTPTTYLWQCIVYEFLGSL